MLFLNTAKHHFFNSNTLEFHLRTLKIPAPCLNWKYCVMQMNFVLVYLAIKFTVDLVPYL